jgi:hypothetical protein
MCRSTAARGGETLREGRSAKRFLRSRWTKNWFVSTASRTRAARASTAAATRTSNLTSDPSQHPSKAHPHAFHPASRCNLLSRPLSRTGPNIDTASTLHVATTDSAAFFSPSGTPYMHLLGRKDGGARQKRLQVSARHISGSPRVAVSPLLPLLNDAAGQWIRWRFVFFNELCRSASLRFLLSSE